MNKIAQITGMVSLAFALGVGALAGCGPINDGAWRGDDNYGTGQRGTIVPNGGHGTYHQRDTARAPVTPN
jgi:hypothetical protein